MNEIGRVGLRTAEPLPADDYSASRRTGSFLVIDPADGGTVAAGLVGAPMPVLDGESSAEPADHLVSPGP